MKKKGLFKSGFEMVMDGSIDRELTAGEIQIMFPEIDPLEIPVFQNGIIDALENDWFRYNLADEREY